MPDVAILVPSGRRSETMETETEGRMEAPRAERGRRRHSGSRRETGLILIVIGALFAVAQVFESANIGQLVLLLLGALLYGRGLVRRSAASLVPGGILLGLGAGVLLAGGPLAEPGSGLSGALFMFAFAAGWLSITVGTALVTDEIAWWPLLPGGIMALLGAAALGAPLGLEILGLLGNVWWLILIAVGLYLVLVRERELPAGGEE
jgi:hypothetical protein